AGHEPAVPAQARARRGAAGEGRRAPPHPPPEARQPPPGHAALAPRPAAAAAHRTGAGGRVHVSVAAGPPRTFWISLPVVHNVPRVPLLPRARTFDADHERLRIRRALMCPMLFFLCIDSSCICVVFVVE
uniref:Uncharacterized protein n=1 Tax=Aegilops tauschii subsp. strangulata TaxID=200361 RepID=A0A453JSX5_AEGTS